MLTTASASLSLCVILPTTAVFMTTLIDRIEDHPAGAVVRSNGVRVDEVAMRLEAGGTLEEVMRDASLQPRDLVAALAWLGLGSESSGGPSLVQEPPRHPKLAKALDESAFSTLFPEASRPARLALSAGLLQVLDHWDASHHAAQEADDLGEQHVSAYWHGIAHRREPDAGNALYWFRRVGRHPLFGPLGVVARDLLIERRRDDLADRLTSHGTWDPGVFIKLTESARRNSPDATICRHLQRLEMALLLDATLDAIDSK